MSRAIIGSSSVGTTRASTGPSGLMRPAVAWPCRALASGLRPGRGRKDGPEPGGGPGRCSRRCAGEHERVQPVQAHHHPGYCLSQDAPNLERQPGPVIPRSGRGLHRPHVVAHAGQARQPARRIQRLSDLIHHLASLAGQVAEHTGVDIPRPGAHQPPLQRGQPEFVVSTDRPSRTAARLGPDPDAR